MEQEIWKDIPGYEGLYQVSNLGRVKAPPKCVGRGKKYLVGERMLSLKPTRRGYVRVHLDKDGDRKFFSVHRLVAMVFIDNPLGLPCVNHKNEIKDDNRVDNLEWCTEEYNSNFGSRNLRISESKMGHEVSKETRDKLSRMNTGNLNPMYGTKRSPETCKKISDGIKKHYANRFS